MGSGRRTGRWMMLLMHTPAQLHPTYTNHQHFRTILEQEERCSVHDKIIFNIFTGVSESGKTTILSHFETNESRPLGEMMRNLVSS